MIDDKRIVIVFPAYNLGKTLKMTYNEIPFDIVDDIILVDDVSSDDTVEEAKKLDFKQLGESKMQLYKNEH